jgi:hypothetical protein
VVSEVNDDIIKMSCLICDKDIPEGESVYLAVEGKHVNGAFSLADKERRGVYCAECIPGEEVLPFLCDV